MVCEFYINHWFSDGKVGGKSLSLIWLNMIFVKNMFAKMSLFIVNLMYKGKLVSIPASKTFYILGQWPHLHVLVSLYTFYLEL
jgi:hypothetical protein